MGIKERWEKVLGYENLYKVSDLGRIIRSGRGKGTRVNRLLNPHQMTIGYQSVSLCNKGVKSNLYVHQIVLNAFIGPSPIGDYCCNHKNGNRIDNRLENLEWVTRSQNYIHAYRVLGNTRDGLPGEKNYFSVLSEKDVLEIRALHNQGLSRKLISKRFGVCKSTIANIINRRNWTHI